MPHLPSSTEPLPDYVRRASSIKPRYDIWRTAENGEGGEWVRVKRKQHDRQEDTLTLTLADGTEVTMRGTDRIRSRRLAPQDQEEGKQ
jgi:hypothetical protein